jgi:hypothetical protein
MKRMKEKSIRSYLFITICLCTLIGLLSFRVDRSKTDASALQINPSVKSLVSKLEIVQSKMIGPNTLQVIMKNSYQKDITAVVASIGAEKVIRRDYIYAELEQDQKLSAGAADEFLYSIDSREEENVVVTAVLFSDMTKDGDHKAIKSVLDKRRGVKIQLARFNGKLETLNKIDHKQLRTEFRNLKSFAESLPIRTDEGAPVSEALEFGLKHGRALILRYLSEMNFQLGDEKVSNLTDDKQSERFRDKSLRVQKDFESLVRRL